MTSTCGHCLFLDPNTITWCYKKQQVVAQSSVEVEYRGLSSTMSDLTWVQTILTEIGICLSQTPVVWCDNSSVISLASSHVQND